MKTIGLIITAFLLTVVVTLNAQTKKTESIKVYGSCEMCEKNIETALDIKGIKKADWNKETKVLNLEFDSTKITPEKIHVLISEAGYSTDKLNANPEAKKSLAKCCRIPDPKRD